MFDHVIVPFDGGLECRAALAPAGDLAWRCGAKVVVVTTNDVDDEALRLVLKTRAIAKSGADVDFWVDLDHDLDAALVAAAVHRSRPVVCVASRYRRTGVLGRRVEPTTLLLGPVADGRFPELVVGPETDVSRGLPLTEVAVYLDGSEEGFAAVGPAREMALSMRIGVRLVAVVEDGDVDHSALVDHLRVGLEALDGVGGTHLDLLEARTPADGLVGLLGDLPDTVAVLAPRGRGRAWRSARRARGRAGGPLAAGDAPRGDRLNARSCAPRTRWR